ncbi:MAG: DNA mismatch repair protein MutS [Hyphomicrobium sp.]
MSAERKTKDKEAEHSLEECWQNEQSSPYATSSSSAHVMDATPSMAQYLEIKSAHPDSLLWYRMGDFYELFFEDAAIASAALGIVLTKRGRHQGTEIPMCGVPVHRSDEYLQRLIRHGHRVAICEQLEDPSEAKKRGYKAIVRRDVVRLVTPGTLTEDTLLEAKARNYLTAIFWPPSSQEYGLIDSRSLLGLASLDISTGEMETGEIYSSDLAGELMRLSPSEIIATDAVLIDKHFKACITGTKSALTPVPSPTFDSVSGETGLKSQLGLKELISIGDFSRNELAAIGALLRYVNITQIGKRPHLRPPKRINAASALMIDAATRASLELIQSTSGSKTEGCLLAAIDYTVTAAGARELAARLSNPQRDLSVIERRLDAVSYLVEDPSLREKIRNILRSAPDIARSVSRLAFGRGGPRDLAALRDGINAAENISTLHFKEESSTLLPSELKKINSNLQKLDPTLLKELKAAIIDNPPHLKREGNFVREGYRETLDTARRLKDDSRQIMAGLEVKYAELAGIKNLKIRHNNILGFFVEVTQLNSKSLSTPPLDAVFRHRQTMANAMRFTTAELAETEGQIASASERALAIEQEVFQEITTLVADHEQSLASTASSLAELDLYCALAELAVQHSYNRPTLTNDTELEILGGRHPVVETALLRNKEAQFIENDCHLGLIQENNSKNEEQHNKRIWLVTGPNMAGKSTFLRQNALIVILAQMGSFVPARKAHIGIVDRLFSRVGASDDLARGRSTFMVEMVETASILNQASERSLVILDEIGRGTATFDGLSIAWATVEYLHDCCKCRALFATHYHELTTLAQRLGNVGNVTMDVKEWRDEIIFLHKVRSGAADRSYGIQVAKLAGLPQQVIERAKQVLDILEKSESQKNGSDQLLLELPLFAKVKPSSKNSIQQSAPSALEEALEKINPDELTPKAALEALYSLKKIKHKK